MSKFLEIIQNGGLKSNMADKMKNSVTPYKMRNLILDKLLKL